MRDSKIALISLVAFSTWLFVALPLIYLPRQPQNTFFGLDSTTWTAIGAMANVAYCLLTGGLLLFASYQIRSAKAEAKINRTLVACDRYDTDPVLDRVTRRIAEGYADGTLAKDTREYNIDLESLFNYFESIAIGVSKGLYDKDIVRDQLKSIIIYYVDELIVTGLIGWTDAGEDFEHMMKLYSEWKAN